MTSGIHVQQVIHVMHKGIKSKGMQIISKHQTVSEELSGFWALSLVQWVGVGYRKNEGAEMTRKHNSPMNQYQVKLCLAICDQSRFQVILALTFNGYFTIIQMFDAKNQPFHSLTLHIDRVDTKDWHYFKLLAGTCVCGATSTSVTCNSSHFWHSELKKYWHKVEKHWERDGALNINRISSLLQVNRFQLQVQDNMKQPCAMLCSAMQCYAMLLRCQTVKVSHCLMAVKAFITRLCAWMIW